MQKRTAFGRAFRVASASVGCDDDQWLPRGFHGTTLGARAAPNGRCICCTSAVRRRCRLRQRLGLGDEEASDAVQETMRACGASLDPARRSPTHAWAFRTLYRLASTAHRLTRRPQGLVERMGDGLAGVALTWTATRRDGRSRCGLAGGRSGCRSASGRSSISVIAPICTMSGSTCPWDHSGRRTRPRSTGLGHCGGDSTSRTNDDNDERIERR